VTRHPQAFDWTLVPDAPFVGGPALGYRRPAWPAATRRWWSVVSTMPHCSLWSRADWQFALDTAEVHARFVAGGGATELRIREKLLGVTLDARRDLRIRYVQAAEGVAGDAEAPANVLNLDDFRDL